MVKTLLADSLRFDEGQEVPLWQHPHFRDETRPAQKRTIPFLPLKLREINTTLRNGMTSRIDILQPFRANPFGQMIIIHLKLIILVQFLIV